jgi:peptidoglycan/LPS O-acetylase OafA/YrhL
MLLVDTAALLLSILAAYLSYRYLESPFLKLKQRFEVVKSRPM